MLDLVFVIILFPNKDIIISYLSVTVTVVLDKSNSREKSFILSLISRIQSIVAGFLKQLFTIYSQEAEIDEHWC